MSISTSEYRQQFVEVIEFFREDTASLRTGTASQQMLDQIEVEAYGGRMKIREVASVSVPDPTLIVLSPWDKSLLKAIEKAIQGSNLNVNPVVDGEIVRIPVPPLTEERRKETVKLLHEKAESARVMARNVRTDVKKLIEAQEGEAGISEDDVARELKELDDVSKEFLSEIDSVTQLKETELMKL